MKRLTWWLLGLVVLVVILVLLFVSRSEYGALQADYDTLQQQNSSLATQLQQAQSDLTELQADYDGLNADYEAVNAELTEIQRVYPPRDFSSLSELRNWLLSNDVSEQPWAMFPEGLYSKALEIQEDALRDGYIVSVDLDYDLETDLFYIFCVTIINGDIWFWDPETDEPYQDYSLGKVK